MKLSEAKHYLPLIQAAAEGKTLQVLVDGGVWSTFTPDATTDFSSPPDHYRVKPEAREFTLVRCPNTAHPKQFIYEHPHKPTYICKECEVIRVREVIEGEQ